MALSRVLARLAVVSTVVVGGAVIAALPAQAYPSGCETYKHGSYADAECSGGTGHYRVVARCDKWWWPDYTLYGPWVNPGNQSVVRCKSGDVVKTAQVEFV
jgi:hypothetical protein